MADKIITVKNIEGEADTKAVIIHENNIKYTPKVSVIIPVYNTENYLRECLDSVINQTLKEIEIICIDDGSTDSSLEILKEYAKKDNRFTIVTQQNLHAGVARNAGLTIAKGEYVYFLDSDDWLELYSYSKLFDIAKNNNVDLVKFRGLSYNNLTAEITPTSYLNISGIDEKFFNNILHLPNDIHNAIKLPDSPWSGFYNTKFLIDNGICFDNSICANDVGFFYRCIANAKTIYLCSEKLIYYRENMKTSLVGIRASHFECQTNLYDIVKKIISNLPADDKNLILNKIISSTFMWYDKYKQDFFLPLQTKVYIDKEMEKFLSKISTANLSYENIILKKIILKHKSILTSRYFSISYRPSKNNKWYTNINFLGLKLKLRNKNLENLHKRLIAKNFTSAISVIVPVYNAEKYLSKCLDSLINQTLKDIEIICIDDCSTDNSLQILNSYAKKDSRIKVIHLNKNKKQGGARNAGLDIAKGKYITFVDADDYVDSIYCEVLHKNIIENDADLVIANITNYINSENERLKNIKRDFDKYYKKTQFKNGLLNYSFNDGVDFRTGAVAKLYRADIININNIRFPENLIQEDEAFYWYYMVSVSKIFILNDSIYNRLFHEESTMFKKIYNNQGSEDFLKILEEIYRFLNENKMFNKYKKKYKKYFNSFIYNVYNDNLSKKDRKILLSNLRYLAIKCKVPLTYFFSIMNVPLNDGKWRKVIRILGLELSFRNKKKEARMRILEESEGNNEQHTEKHIFISK